MSTRSGSARTTWAATSARGLARTRRSCSTRARRSSRTELQRVSPGCSTASGWGPTRPAQRRTPHSAVRSAFAARARACHQRGLFLGVLGESGLCRANFRQTLLLRQRAVELGTPVVEQPHGVLPLPRLLRLLARELEVDVGDEERLARIVRKREHRSERVDDLTAAEERRA